MTSVMLHGKVQPRTTSARKPTSVGIVAFALVALAAIFPACAEVAVYENVFEGEMLGYGYPFDGYSYDLSVWENRFECHAYGPWGTPSLLIGITCNVSGDTATTTLTARYLESPAVELDTYYEDPLVQNYDPRAAWFVTTAARTRVSVSNTVYSSSVFKDESTGRNIPEEAFTYTGQRSDTKYLYLCYGHPNGTTVGWVKIGIWGEQAWVDSSCIATGVYSLKVASADYTLWPVDPATFLNGGIRQIDIFVDASVSASGTGLSWESPLKSIQEAVDAVRLDGTTVHVKPGVYGAVTVDNSKFTTNNLSYTFTVESTDGPEKTIIDGGGLSAASDGSSGSSPTRACFWYGDNPVPLYDTIRGFTLRNSLYGVQYGNVERCIVSNCLNGIMYASAFNCLIAGNKRIGFGGDRLLNCTVVGNLTGITIAKACNSIVCGNTTDNAYDYSFMYATNCCIPVVSMVNQNNVVVVGPGNMMMDPCYVDAAAGDYRLRPDSPCIDAGLATHPIGSADLSGGMRVRGGNVDLGCFEFVPTVSNTDATHGVTVPPEWLEAHYCLDRATSPDAAYQTAALSESANLRDGTAAGGRLLAWECYLWDLDPTDSDQMARAEITMAGGVPQVRVVPSSDKRAYTLLGKASLEAGEWARSDDFSDAAFLGTNRFFKVSVDLK